MNVRVWIFDLDDTLHNASAHIFPEMNGAMTAYIKESLYLDDDSADHLRKHYWKIYGATLKGLMRHHGTNPHHFLNETHKFPDLADRVIKTKRLRHTLTQLKGRKVIFTNAPRNYALRVLDLLGIS
ncbi:MAG TPA: pyrimidine 5'-nucleotidase, partial [Methylophilaceae bacterium]|nr:pyrimidine 5'-nucleotidase [Methylophilaceae bacterium]